MPSASVPKSWIPRLRLHKNLLRANPNSGKEYHKYTIYIPPYVLEKMGWAEESTYLLYSIEGEKLIITRDRSQDEI